MLVIRQGAAETLRPQLTRILYGNWPPPIIQQKVLDHYLEAIRKHEGVRLPTCQVFFRPFEVRADHLYAIIPNPLPLPGVLEVPRWVVDGYDGVFHPAPGPSADRPGGHREVLVHTPENPGQRFYALTWPEPQPKEPL